MKKFLNEIVECFLYSIFPVMATVLGYSGLNALNDYFWYDHTVFTLCFALFGLISSVSLMIFYFLYFFHGDEHYQNQADKTEQIANENKVR